MTRERERERARARQPGYYNRGADGDSAATGTKSPSRRIWSGKFLRLLHARVEFVNKSS